MRKEVGKPGFAINLDIKRPEIEKIRTLSQYSVPIISDGLGRCCVMDAAIKPLNPNLKLCGPAITVEVRVGDNLMIHAALKIAKEGDVLVINAHGDLHHGLWGEITTRVAIKKRLGGVILDGAVRDSMFISNTNLPLYCRGVMPCGGGKDGPGVVNFPISCGGVVVHPGDVIVGDSDGIVVIPQGKIDVAIAEANERINVEDKRIADIEQGDLYPKFLISTLRAKGILKEDEEF